MEFSQAMMQEMATHRQSVIEAPFFIWYLKKELQAFTDKREQTTCAKAILKLQLLP
jgi:hypothetical protein